MKKLLSVLLIVILMLSITGCDCPSENPIECRSIKSCALRTEMTEQSSGKFVILYASIQSEETVTTDYYLYIMGIEGYRLQKINSTDLEIVETDTLEPQIKGRFYSNGKVGDVQDYIAYVPVGTITQEYSTKVGVQK